MPNIKSKVFEIVSATDESVFKQKCNELFTEHTNSQLIDSNYKINLAHQHGRHMFYGFFIFEVTNWGK